MMNGKKPEPAPASFLERMGFRSHHTADKNPLHPYATEEELILAHTVHTLQNRFGRAELRDVLAKAKPVPWGSVNAALSKMVKADRLQLHADKDGQKYYVITPEDGTALADLMKRNENAVASCLRQYWVNSR